MCTSSSSSSFLLLLQRCRYPPLPHQLTRSRPRPWPAKLWALCRRRVCEHGVDGGRRRRRVERRRVCIVLNGLWVGGGRGRKGEGEMGRRGNSCSVLFGAWALSGRVCACANTCAHTSMCVCTYVFTSLFGAWALSGQVCACANIFWVYSRVHISFSSQWVSCGCALFY